MKATKAVLESIERLEREGRVVESRVTPTPGTTHGIIIPNWHPARVNQLLGGHWAKGARLKKADRAVVARYAAGFPKATGKRRVRLRIVLAKGQRAGDPGSYWKSILDALTTCGQGVDDNRQGVILEPVVFNRDTVKRTEIVLEDIDE